MKSNLDSQFFSLTPDRILDTAEQFGVRCTGRALALNSMENRVYEVEIEIADSEVVTPADRFRVVKFYRPGRWTKQQILEEHRFLLSLAKQELPVIAPLPTIAGDTLITVPDLGLFAAIFPKRGGQMEPELSDEKLAILGRLIARMHAIGRARPATSRLCLTPSVYGRDNLAYLINHNVLPRELAETFSLIVNQICDRLDVLFLSLACPPQRIHGDLHHGNILWAGMEPRLLDFDDMMMGPPVQDVWLILPGRDDEALRQRNILLEAYEQFMPFDWSSLAIVEGLRALRLIHFCTWIAKRWQDPSFPRAFPQFGSNAYWLSQIADLTDQLQAIE
jgi:Ser/Thr protein kinase RdoA (MazF antagonist)